MDCPKKINYTIRRQDTLFRVAYSHRTTEEHIAALNPGLDPLNLRVGQVIAICPRTASMVPARPMPRKSPVSPVSPGPSAPALPDMAPTTGIDTTPQGFFRRLRTRFEGNAAEKLLDDFLKLAEQWTRAVGKDEERTAGETEIQWREKADEIAAALTALHPRFDPETLKKMLADYVKWIQAEIEARLAVNPVSEAAAREGHKALALRLDEMTMDAGL